MELNVTLDLPPSVNRAYINRRNSYQRVLSKEANKWMVDAVQNIKRQMLLQGWETQACKIIMDCNYLFPDKRTRDNHNYLKLLCDAVERAGVVENDKYLLPRTIDYIVKKNISRVDISFRKFV